VVLWWSNHAICGWCIQGMPDRPALPDGVARNQHPPIRLCDIPCLHDPQIAPNTDSQDRARCIGWHERKDGPMRSQEELTQMFTEYFGDKLTPAQIDRLATDVRTSVHERHTHDEPAARASRVAR
jgi:hypothetical protein